MHIKKLKLKNIRSYKEICIEFNKGVNFISGQNGAGKTTIIESIAFAIFGSAPKQIKNDDYFLRYGETQASIEVEFTINEIDFLIIRKIGKTTSQKLSCLSNNDFLDIDKIEDIELVLKEQLNLKEEKSLSNLYEKIVGVRQGGLTAGFLEAKKDRKTNFDKMLGVDSYKKATDNKKDVVDYIKEVLNENSTKIQVLQAQTKDESVNKQQFDLLASEKQTTDNELIVLAKQKTKIERKIQLFNQQKQKISDLEKSDLVLEQQIKSNQEILQSKQSQLLIAQKAFETTTALEPVYQEFIQKRERNKEFDKKRKQRDQMLQQFSALETKNQVFEKEIKIEFENANKTIKQQTQEKQILLQDIEQINKQAQQSSLQLKNNKSILDELKKNIEAKEKQQKEDIDSLRLNIGSSISLADKIFETKQKIENNLIGFLNNEKQIFETIKAHDDLTKNQIDLEFSKNTDEETLKTLKQELENFESGKCPYNGELCVTVDSLKRNHETQIQKTLNQIKEINQKINENKIELNKNAKIYNLATKEEINIENAEMLFKNAKAENIKNIALQEKFEQEKDEVLKQLGKILVAEPLTFEIDFLKQQARTYCDAKEQELSNMKEKTEKQAKITQQKDLEYQKFLSEIAHKNENLKRIDNQICDAEKIVSENAEKKQKLTESKKIKDQVFEELEKFKNLDEQSQAITEFVEKNQTIYDEYMTKIGLANDLEKIQEQKKALESQIDTLEKQTNKNKQELEKFKQSFEEGKLEEFNLMQQENSTQLGISQQKIQNINQEIEKLNDYFEKTNKIKEEIEIKQKQQEKNICAENFFKTAIDVLNNAGTKIAQTYREALSKKAQEIYCSIAAQKVDFFWSEDYDIILEDMYSGAKRKRFFRQLSGGEQMTAALALRLAMLQNLSTLDIAFFDEPTANLDEGRRQALASVLPQATENFEQVFLISHDDTFEPITQNAIVLSAGQNGTIVVE